MENGRNWSVDEDLTGRIKERNLHIARAVVVLFVAAASGTYLPYLNLVTGSLELWAAGEVLFALGARGKKRG